MKRKTLLRLTATIILFSLILISVLFIAQLGWKGIISTIIGMFLGLILHCFLIYTDGRLHNAYRLIMVFANEANRQKIEEERE